MASLYEIAQEIRHALAACDEGGEFQGGDVADYLDAVEMSFADKLEHCCRYIRELEADALKYQNEADRLASAAKFERNRAERMKKYILDAMESAGVQKMDTELFKVSVCKNSAASVEVDDSVHVTSLPEKFLRCKYEVNKIALAKAAASGEDIPDGVTVTFGKHVRIR